MGAGLPKTPEQFHKIPHARVAIIGGSWHSDCVDAMINRAEKELLALDVKPENISVHKVPGSLELPLAARLLFEKDPELDAVLAFGVVLEGITSHDESVLHAVVNGFQNVTERFGKPVINEVIGVTSIEDAHKRSGDNHMNKGVEAVYATSELLNWIHQL
ncbi:6,7-dimethyl-8-ribityllumazine synthase [Endozoicomonas ascidiicola]|uniref:6,7-dimethyl-8-ribityllumazine synthase n=1 Tax=Endozoicomonas ascidiicola TaxID=1698521 RepID=UPI00082B0AC3|nr:6,7-dimethyl-8-ribityllumazine synthase [Endozoicomonas ascidiicola]